MKMHQVLNEGYDRLGSHNLTKKSPLHGKLRDAGWHHDSSERGKGTHSFTYHNYPSLTDGHKTLTDLGFKEKNSHHNTNTGWMIHHYTHDNGDTATYAYAHGRKGKHTEKITHTTSRERVKDIPQTYSDGKRTRKITPK